MPAYVLSVVATVGLSAADSGWGTSHELLHDLHGATTVGITVSFAVGSLLSLGIGPLLWGLAGRDCGLVSQRLARLLIVVGVTGLVWAVPVEHPVALVLIMVNVLGALVAFVALSLALIRGGRTTPAAEAPRGASS